MSKPVESFFDLPAPGFDLWTFPDKPLSIDMTDIIFQAPMYKFSENNMKFKQRYFVLTQDYLFYLHSEEVPTIVAYMPTQWVRVDYLPNFKTTPFGTYHCFRFVRNMKFVDLFCDNDVHFNEWKENLARVFIQCDFHTKFNTIKMIGKGSFARVYLIENKKTKKMFAVKAFSKEYLLSQPKGRESLMNEIEVMQKLKHPYIMNLEEIHESKNSVYLVVELLEGGELLHYISNKDSLSTVDFYQVMKCILEALAYMAEKNIMHRDLKPDNMILKERNKLHQCTLKIVDFGLSTVCDIPEYLFKRCGTPGYVAPEVINAPSNVNIHYGPKCDVFSVGVIFYIMLTQRSPFDGKSFKEILQKNKNCHIDFDHYRLQSNASARDLLIRMLDKNPETRVSAKDALKHPFFTEIEEARAPIEKKTFDHGELTNFQSIFRKKHQNENQNDANSFVMRDRDILGNLNSVCNSANSNGAILSLKSMASPVTKANPQAHKGGYSLLKNVLINNSEQMAGTLYDGKFNKQLFESDCEFDC
jgi:serine/threonine protein kinase